MPLNYTACFYHPDKIAVSVCERCRRPICLEDKQVFNYNSRYSRRKSYYSFVSRDYCPSCYSLLINPNMTTTPLTFVLLFFVIFFIMIIGIFFMVGITETFPFILIFFLIFFGIAFFIIAVVFISIVSLSKSQPNYYIKPNQYTEEQVRFQQRNLDGYNEHDFEENLSKQTILESQRKKTISCYECGSYLTVQDKFCPNCGDSTHDELIDYYKV